MCDALDGGDSREYRGRLYKRYGHIDELFNRLDDGTSGTDTLICNYPDEHSTRYQRWDWRMKSYEYIEIVWHGFRQRDDVNVPNTIF